uniref:BTB/POZ domain-containing protein n=1 Tax=Mola mola TaxID=94237 RepID=A0A3Q3XBB3_MOLML
MTLFFLFASDVIRPPSAAVAKKPTTASAATRKPEPSKPTAIVKINSVSKSSTTTKTADPKVSQTKTQQPVKSTSTKKPVAAARFPAINKPPVGRTPPASPANKPANSTMSQVKRGTKPTQAVSPFTATKKTGLTNTTTPTRAEQSAAGAAIVAAASADTVLPERLVETAGSLQHESSPAAPALQEVPPVVLSQDVIPEVVQEETVQSCPATSSPSQSPVRTTLPQTSPFQERLQSIPPSLTVKEQTPAAVEPTLLPLGSPPIVAEEPLYLLNDETPSTFEALQAAANAIPRIVSYTNLNEEEDAEEREGSQLVSESDMSGTTQPTEESCPGSAGPVGGSAWRTGGALLSELDSEEVSGSQQGASELSAPGVLEGTESIDDLGDGSLKGAIDMEGASAGSPDFEKVPDIPVNDFDEEDDEEDEDDDDDRVCDMDVGSERADEVRRPRHDNYLDDEEDEDIEMASEGVTESGLESYGNADEDDFVEDEKLDNLNRVAQPPPPPPLLPSAPACPMADPWQADSETPTQTPAQAWLEQGSGPFALVTQEAPHHSFVRDEPQNLEAQMYVDQSNTIAAPVPLSAPGVSRSSTMSSETTTPEELGEYYRDGKFQLQDVHMPVFSPQPVLDYQDVGIHMKTEDPEEEEEVVGGSANAPTSNPSSSSSVTEDEPSNPEGKVQLDESLDSPIVSHVTFDSQPTAQCCLSTVEEGEEAEIEDLSGTGEDTTPPSATSLASYAFETITTASNSNVKSTGESCIKSPGIFSLEKLPQEANEPGAIPQPHTVSCLAEQQQYIECGKQEAESAEHVGQKAPEPEETLGPLPTPRILQAPVESLDDIQPPYYSAFCKNTENSLAAHPLKLTCADLPTRSLVQQILSPQLHRLEQHQRQLLELQQRREQQSRQLEGAEKMREQAEVTKKEEEEQLRKQEELKQRRDLELQLQQQQKELKQRQQIMQWQQELQQSNNGQNVLLSPSSGLCTIYEALENSDDEVEREEEGMKEINVLESRQKTGNAKRVDKSENVTSDEDKLQELSAPHFPDFTQTPSIPSQDGDSPPESSEQPSPLDLDWGKKVDIVQQLINQTLLLNRESCSSLLLLPGGAGGTLSPLESS